MPPIKKDDRVVLRKRLASNHLNHSIPVGSFGKVYDIHQYQGMGLLSTAAVEWENGQKSSVQLGKLEAAPLRPSVKGANAIFNGISLGSVQLPTDAACLTVSDFDHSDLTVEIDIDEVWFNATDLRAAANFFNDLADKLESLKNEEENGTW